MKKRLITYLVVLFVAILPVSAFANNTNGQNSFKGFLSIDSSKLSDTQKADIKAYNQKLADLQKELLNQMVKNGTITQAQADTEIKKIDEALKNNDGTKLIKGFGVGVIKNFKNNETKKTPNNGSNNTTSTVTSVYTPTLTTTQKDVLKANLIDIANLNKATVATLVSKNVITDTKAKAESDKLDLYIANLNKNGLPVRFNPINQSNFGLIRYSQNPKLTEDQKAVITNYTTQLLSLQKIMVTNLVSFNTLTQAQADSLLQIFQAQGTLNKGINHDKSSKVIPGKGKAKGQFTQPNKNQGKSSKTPSTGISNKTSKSVRGI